ncbi:hypothetical protein ECTOBSL9_2805 [Ectothiorhodospira sp. BSL-9]|nr:hypothetical protein ECTOBSL9_2805 [Ectothiorhodospira sp. BSL-9]
MHAFFKFITQLARPWRRSQDFLQRLTNDQAVVIIGIRASQVDIFPNGLSPQIMSNDLMRLNNRAKILTDRQMRRKKRIRRV